MYFFCYLHKRNVLTTFDIPNKKTEAANVEIVEKKRGRPGSKNVQSVHFFFLSLHNFVKRQFFFYVI